MVLNLLIGNTAAYTILGGLNRLSGWKIKTVFLLYPANEKYTHEYVYGWYAKSMRWKPRIVGLFRQNQKWGITFAVSSPERDFFKEENTANLYSLATRLEEIRHMLGASQKTFAGIIPSILNARNIIKNPPENAITVMAVQKAVATVIEKEQLPLNTPIVVLGGQGFIGKNFIAAAESAGKNPTYSIDVNNKADFDDLITKLKDKPAIILNISKKGALREYTPHLWPGAIVLNEVYPEPTKTELKIISERGAKCYHIVGAKGQAWPSFPRAYQGAIPCCASFRPDKTMGEYEVVIQKKC